MARETVRAIMRDVPATADGVRPRKIDNNTVRYFRPPQDHEFRGVKPRPALLECVRLHHSDVICKNPDTGDCELYTGGWQTVTTADRIRRYSPAHLYSKRGQWFLGDVPFFDGIRVSASGEVLNPGPKAEKAADKRKATLAKIKKFCAPLLDKSKPLPVPGPGDCWGCMMRPEKTGEVQFNTLAGQSGPDASDCVALHLKENYLHGHLILRALSHQGYKNPALIYQMGLRENIYRAVYKFMKRKLGVG